MNQVEENEKELLEQEKPFRITNGSLKEEFCEFGYEVLIGPQKGFKIPKCKGSSMAHHDMVTAFNELDIHLAVSIDSFKYTELSNSTFLQELREHEIAETFHVNAFVVKGADENESIILIGSRQVSIGHTNIESPKITEISNYAFFEDLKTAIDNCIIEVEAYMNGKCAPQYEQTTLDFPENGEEAFKAI